MSLDEIRPFFQITEIGCGSRCRVSWQLVEDASQVRHVELFDLTRTAICKR